MAHRQGQGSMNPHYCHFVDVVLIVQSPFYNWYIQTEIVAVGDN